MLDDQWTYGGDDESLARTIRDGRAEAGMPAFTSILDEPRIREMIFMIRSLASRAKGRPATRATKSVDGVITTDRHTFRIDTLTDALETPWGMAVLPDGRVLVTERPGRLRIIEKGRLLAEPVGGIPKVWTQQDGGLFDVEAHPRFSENGWIYLSYAEPRDGNRSMTVVMRGRLANNQLVDQVTIARWPDEWYGASNIHYGSRFIFDRDGYLYFSIGDRGRAERAQDLSAPVGKIHRVTDDGRPAPGNPFANRTGALPTIWSYGNRNPQGFAWHPVTGELWETEHGPRGGDEVNVIRGGGNYGWPVVSFGILDSWVSPSVDRTATAATFKEGMAPPITHYSPSPGISPMLFYTGNGFPGWKNDLLVGMMRDEELKRLSIEGHKVVKEEVLFRGLGRVRDIAQASDGSLYVALATPGASVSDTTAGRIVRLTPVTPVAQPPAHHQGVTFTRDIAPIIFTSCVSCHRRGGPAPFSLATYEDVRRRATQIAAVTRSRFMPPWKVEPGVGHFVGQHPLTEQQIALIGAWVRGGTPRGQAQHLPAMPAWPDGWLLGRPDLIVKPAESFALQAQPADAFRIFAIHVPIARRTYVRGIEFHPGNARVVHHANIRIDRTSATRQLDEADPLPGYDGLMPRSAEYPSGHFLGWTPGQVAPLVSPDLAWTLEPGSDLVVQLHLQPSGAVEQVQPEIGFFFSDQPPTRTPTILRLGSQGIDIPPGESRFVIRDAFVLPVDVQLLATQPHAHYRAREIRGVADLPDGTSRLVMHIKDWDFRWQHVYREVTPIRLPRGTRLSMEYTYDNSAANVRNPQLPPARVFWGQRSKDEMGDLWFQLLADNERDRRVMDAQITGKMSAEDIVGYETMLRADPRDVGLHDDVALLYLGMGQAADAVRHFEASAALRPESAPARFNLGTALAHAGRLDEAVTAFRAALATRPEYGLAHTNLGRVLLTQGKTADALNHLQEAVRLDATNAQAIFGLSEAFAAAGSYSMAVAMADRALTLKVSEELAQQIRAKREEYLRRRPPGAV